MNETLRQVLDSKDQIIQGLQTQLYKQKKALEQSRKARRDNDEELSEKQADVIKLRQRITNMRALIESKKEDPEKVLKIQSLKKQIEQKKKTNENKLQQVQQAKNEIHNLKDKEVEMDLKRGDMYAMLEKYETDLDDKEQLEKRIKQSKQSVADLLAQ